MFQILNEICCQGWGFCGLQGVAWLILSCWTILSVEHCLPLLMGPTSSWLHCSELPPIKSTQYSEHVSGTDGLEHLVVGVYIQFFSEKK